MIKGPGARTRPDFWRRFLIVSALLLTVGPLIIGRLEVAHAQESLIYQMRAARQLRSAIELGSRVLQELSTPEGPQRLNEILPEMRQMLAVVKGALELMDVAKHVSKFDDSLLDWSEKRTDRTLGLIRHGIDRSGEGLTWGQYLSETLPRLHEAVATLQQVVDVMP